MYKITLLTLCYFLIICCTNKKSTENTQSTTAIEPQKMASNGIKFSFFSKTVMEDLLIERESSNKISFSFISKSLDRNCNISISGTAILAKKGDGETIEDKDGNAFFCEIYSYKKDKIAYEIRIEGKSQKIANFLILNDLNNCRKDEYNLLKRID